MICYLIFIIFYSCLKSGHSLDTMNLNLDIEIISDLGTLNSFNPLFAYLKVIVDPDFENNRNLYIFIPCIRRVTCYKLLTNSLSSGNCFNKDSFTASTRSSFLHFEQSLRFSASLFDITTSLNDVWVVDSKGFLSIRSLLKNNNAADECMETTIKEDYPFCGFETVVSANDFLEHSFPDRFSCSKCDLSENSILVCYENEELFLWQLTLVFSNSSSTHRDLEYIPLLSFSSSFPSETDLFLKSEQGKVWKPEVLFSCSNQPIWKNVFDYKIGSASNYICLIGQPDGTVAYCLCSWLLQKKEFKQLLPFQKLCKLEESISGIYFKESVGNLIRSNTVIIIGEKGKLLVITSEKFPCDAESSHPANGLWILSWQLPSSVHRFIILKDSIIYCSHEGDVWIAKFHANDSEGINHVIKVTSKVSDFKNICSLTLINEEDGVFLMITKTGCMYLMEHSSTKNTVNNKSLPVLMNGILEQNILMKEMVSIKHLQSRLFTELTTFANIKFGATNNFHLKCKMVEIGDLSKKLLVTIHLDGLQQLNLDTEFWMISASIFNPWQMDSAIITKCLPLMLDGTIHLEVLESNFCPSFTSLFPLYLEVGLVLRIPERYRSIDCFKDIAKKLPLYVRTNTAILTELYLLKNKSKMFQTAKLENNAKSNILQQILSKNIKNPLYKGVKCNPRIPVINKYTHCLLESSSEDIFKHLSEDLGLEQCIFQKILEKSCSLPNSDGNNLLCRNEPLSLSVMRKDKKVNIVISSECHIVLGLKTAIAELLFNSQHKNNHETFKSISIPAAILKICEELSKELRGMYGQDVTACNFIQNVLKIYCKLRKEVSEKLPL